MNASDKPLYGIGDNTFQAAGGEQGLVALVNNFYDRMSNDRRFARIFQLHRADLQSDNMSLTRDKLVAFLSGWMGGPKRYHEQYGSINIPAVHRHLPIGEVERDQWLLCMKESIDEQTYPPAFKAYLMEELSKPAEMIRRACQQQTGH